MAEHTIPMDTTTYKHSSSSTVDLFYGLSRGPLTDTTNITIFAGPSGRPGFTHPTRPIPGAIRIVHGDVLVIEGKRYEVWCPADWKQMFPALRLI